MKQSIWWQFVMPQLVLSRVLGKLAHSRRSWFKNWAIATFSKYYQVDLSEAQYNNYVDYPSFNAFFTRQLKPEMRSLDQPLNRLLCPIDGTVSEVGQLSGGKLLQAKGRTFSLTSLLGDAELANYWGEGSFLTGYLAPRDYHRFHMPLAGQLRSMHYIPGKLFSVNKASVAGIENLFAKNERVIAVFDTEVGPFAYIAVGAMVVGSIAMSWHGVVNAGHRGHMQSWSYQNKQVVLDRGEECGYFQLGSTVILLFPQNTVAWDSALYSGAALKMGTGIATLKGKNE